MKTTFLTNEEAINKRDWFVVDATDKTVGRLATKIASVLRGKEKPYFTPHQDCGDFVVVVNADKVKFSGNKLKEKTYKHHTGYIGGIKSETAEELLERKPEEVIKKAVKGMLPKTALGKNIFSKMKVYAGAEHPHSAQQPKALES